MHAAGSNLSPSGSCPAPVDCVSVLKASGERSPNPCPTRILSAPGATLERQVSRKVSPCSVLAPTRPSCIFHCKEQPENNGTELVSVSYTRRLVKRDAPGRPR